jgi:hypothetical protein
LKFNIPFFTVILCIFISSCGSHTLVVSRLSPFTEQDIHAAVQELKPGMNAKQMLSIMQPVSNGPHVFKPMNLGVRYFFPLGKNSQIWIQIENRNHLPPLGPDTPNGVIMDIGRIEKRAKWKLIHNRSRKIY